MRKRDWNRGVIGAACVAMAVGMPAIALAVNMAPGAYVSPLPGTTVAAEPQLAGTVVVDETRLISGNFTTTNEPFQLEVHDRVILTGNGTYLFSYSVQIIDKPPVYPLVVTRDGFAGYTTNVGWQSDLLGTVNPSSAGRTADGDAIVFDFGFNVPEDALTRSFFVATDATQFALNSEGVVDLSPSFNVNGRVTFATYGPAVPEPTTLAALAGTIAFVGRRRR